MIFDTINVDNKMELFIQKHQTPSRTAIFVIGKLLTFKIPASNEFTIQDLTHVKNQLFVDFSPQTNSSLNEVVNLDENIERLRGIFCEYSQSECNEEFCVSIINCGECISE